MTIYAYRKPTNRHEVFSVLPCHCADQHAVSTKKLDAVGIFADHADVGAPKKTGTAEYNAATQTYTLTGAGYNIWFGRDEFHYAFNKIKGDFILTANFALSAKAPTHTARSAGWCAGR